MEKALMRQTWRWFGRADKVTLQDARQAGVEGIVTSLYHIPPGTVWSRDEIRKMLDDVRTNPDGTPSGLTWDVVESLPVSEAIKTQTGDWRAHIEAWKTSLENLAAEGLKVVCYNFMPILDWTRTAHRHRLENGGTAMMFDLAEFALFDTEILRRDGAAADYPADVLAQAAKLGTQMGAAERDALAEAIVAGLAGAVESWTVDTLRQQLTHYAGMTNEGLRAHLTDFLREVVPHAEELGMRLCCHPDDPPFSLLGLPKVASTEEDYRLLLAAVDSPANGITLCTGSLGSRDDVDLPGFVKRLGHRIAFVHLRNVTRHRAGVPTGFLEDTHLDGDVDMVAVIGALLVEQKARISAGRADWQIPFRPDHGQELLTDLERRARAGYPAVGRLKGLAEMRGIMHALA